MREKYWLEDDSSNEPDRIEELLSEDLETEFFQGLGGRRKKAAFLLISIWAVVIGLNLVTWGKWVVLALTAVICLQNLQLILTPTPSPPEPLSDATKSTWPSVSLLVAAKNEEAVIAKLVKMLSQLDYPADKYEIWAIDDHSSDRTGIILDELTKQYSQLHVLHRPPGSSGGKSGALNQVLKLSHGEIIGVFDADAQVTPDLLQKVVAHFQNPKIGAVQVQKAIANASTNFWTRGQFAEMAMDTFLQRQRIAVGGMGELRGNGQFVRRAAIDSCGGWNEETITDDLDLTLRLHLDGWDIELLESPPVYEEGVTKAIALWHQRNRWAEGGYQRYLDYWRLILAGRLSATKTTDLFWSFLLIQYLLPTAIVPDFLMALVRQNTPLLAPLTSISLFFSFVMMYLGWRRYISTPGAKGIKPRLTALWQTTQGIVYMLHWVIVMSSTTARMSVRAKRLKWVKTVHQGSSEVLRESET
ncbi:glycosyltransferase [Merismopedia glauca]|uniref:Beta-monoglucosyldiacylglycerol synthase n=1 Tax=Merismopedia glauca CCAP 1448/3 TaxID=1296344 RepID=A0A2T1C1A7_9CYAN|nr:glycosyltransferase family 2 protein [Merismopedia glauca]PSB01958.1 glycosyl transferase [Merismopedia glauca CCAP 1448/3]